MTLDGIKKLFKFSWSQAFSDHSGKSSIMAVSGYTIILTGCLSFMYALYLKLGDGMMYSSANIAVGAGMLSYRKKINGKGDIDVTESIIATVTTETS